MLALQTEMSLSPWCPRRIIKIYDGDKGPNTGGMGAFPSRIYDREAEILHGKNICSHNEGNERRGP